MIKKILLSTVLLASGLFAETKAEYQISLVGMNMDYREYDRSGVLLDSEKSHFTDTAGAEFQYRYFLDDYSNIALNIMGIEGNTEYVGAYINSGLGYGSVVSQTSNTIRDIAIEYNTKNMSDLGVMMLGGIGAGYRYWQRELSSTQIEEYTWYSLRAKIGLEYQYANSITIDLIFAYQYGIDPRMQASGFSSDFKLASANIMQVSIPLRYQINDSLDLSCAYVYEYQKIQESDVVYDSSGTGFVEPDSRASNQYLKVGMIFKY